MISAVVGPADDRVDEGLPFFVPGTLYIYWYVDSGSSSRAVYCIPRALLVTVLDRIFESPDAPYTELVGTIPGTWAADDSTDVLRIGAALP